MVSTIQGSGLEGCLHFRGSTVHSISLTNIHIHLRTYCSNLVTSKVLLSKLNDNYTIYSPKYDQFINVSYPLRDYSTCLNFHGMNFRGFHRP